MKKNDLYIGLYIGLGFWPIIINDTKKEIELLNNTFGKALKKHKTENWEFYLENPKNHLKVLKYED